MIRIEALVSLEDSGETLEPSVIEVEDLKGFLSASAPGIDMSLVYQGLQEVELSISQSHGQGPMVPGANWVSGFNPIERVYASESIFEEWPLYLGSEDKFGPARTHNF